MQNISGCDFINDNVKLKGHYEAVLIARDENTKMKTQRRNYTFSTFSDSLTEWEGPVPNVINDNDDITDVPTTNFPLQPDVYQLLHQSVTLFSGSNCFGMATLQFVRQFNYNVKVQCPNKILHY